MNFMLIDDREIDLFINQKTIEKLPIDANFKTFTSANDAIDYLKTINSFSNLESKFIPNIIFLDMNMPNMNGFQFLNAFSTLNNELLESTRIYMLSSSTSNNEISTAEEHSACNGFVTKPLTVQHVERLLKKVLAI
tara:strand:- start:32373 stop:32780 length:408 start_codon:yes stop_codon:yes gene_type:complete